jgi:hypothetical protein
LRKQQRLLTFLGRARATAGTEDPEYPDKKDERPFETIDRGDSKQSKRIGTHRDGPVTGTSHEANDHDK